MDAISRNGNDMKSISEFPTEDRQRLKSVFLDIDETLTTEGRLTAGAYDALERLHDSGLLVVPITGRPAGWCDHIARMWPVDAVVGENGAFFFNYDQKERRMARHFFFDDKKRQEDRIKLNTIGEQILSEVPGTAISADQAYREADLAIDFCEDVAPLPEEDIARIVQIFESAGATAKISSIHVNGWFGDYDKLAMTKTLFQESFNISLDDKKSKFLFIGDSPNDEPMFEYFPNSVGVANVRDFAAGLQSKPTYVTNSRSGAGFVEFANCLLG